MDYNVISNMFIAKNCARTAGGSEVIDGVATGTMGVQIKSKLIDAGTAAGTYYGAGELLIVDPSGLSLVAGAGIYQAVKAIPDVKIAQRSYDGLHYYSSQAFAGKNITSYEVTKYAAPSEQVSVVHTIDATLADTTYLLKIRRINSSNKDKSVKTVSFHTALAGSTDVQIATGLVAAINANLTDDITVPVTAIVGGAGGDAIIITASALDFIVGAEPYQKLQFVVELVSFDATQVNNVKDDLTYNGITYDHATAGAGTYEQVAEMEWSAKMFSGANTQKVNPGFRIDENALDTQLYEDDGTTKNTYDLVVINWTNTQGDFSQNVRQDGSIIIALPLDDNGTNQQLDIINTLNKYIVTEYGVSSAITLS